MTKMKRVVVFFILIQFHFHPAKGQGTIVFPDSNAIWRDYGWSDSHGPSQYSMYVYDFQYSLEGDTIILGLHYTKMNQTGWQHHIHVYPVPYVHDSTLVCGYYGALRSDSTERVYLFRATDTAECLLYDFGLAVGDTVPLSFIYSTYSYNINIVHSIDSVLIANQYRKRMNISIATASCCFASLIEGIGSTRGLFGSLVVPPGNYCPNLVCFYQDSVNVFSSPPYCSSPTTNACSYISCSSPNGMFSIFKSTQIEVYPNPAQDYLNLDVTGFDNPESLTVCITDETGRLILERQLTSKSSGLNISNIAQGFYIVKLYSKSVLIAQKRFIKY